MRQRKRIYEGMYIISATLSEESRKKAVDKILQGIAEKGGEVLKIHDMGRKKLVYSIQKKKEGHYFLIYFSAPTKIIRDLWKEYYLHEDLLRFMIVQSDSVKESLEFKPLKIQA